MAHKRKKATSGKRTRKLQSGKGVTDVLRKIHSFVKDNKLISRGLAFTPYKGVAAVASQLGYGIGNRSKYPLVMSLNGGRKKKKRKATSGKRLRSAILTNLVGAPIIRRSRRTVRAPTLLARKNPVKMQPRSSLRSVMAPSGATLARRATGQIGGGIFGDIGSGLGSFAHGIFG